MRSPATTRPMSCTGRRCWKGWANECARAANPPLEGGSKNSECNDGFFGVGHAESQIVVCAPLPENRFAIFDPPARGGYRASLAPPRKSLRDFRPSLKGRVP